MTTPRRWMFPTGLIVLKPDLCSNALLELPAYVLALGVNMKGHMPFPRRLSHFPISNGSEISHSATPSSRRAAYCDSLRKYQPFVQILDVNSCNRPFPPRIPILLWDSFFNALWPKWLVPEYCDSPWHQSPSALH